MVGWRLDVKNHRRRWGGLPGHDDAEDQQDHAQKEQRDPANRINDRAEESDGE
jgi:hypothetical protein